MGGLGSDANIWQRLTRLEVDLAASSCWLVDLIHFHSSQVNNLWLRQKVFGKQVILRNNVRLYV
jgi:hypothetical protein